MVKVPLVPGDLDFVHSPDHDIEPIIEVLDRINTKFVSLEALWDGVFKDVENLMMFLMPERPSIVLERLEEVPGVIAGVAAGLFETIQYRLDRIQSISHEILESDQYWKRIAIIKERWIQMLNLNANCIRVSRSFVFSEEISCLLLALESKLKDIFIPMESVEKSLKSMQVYIGQVRSSIDDEFISNLQNVKTQSELSKNEISSCRSKLQTLCSVLNDFLDF